jgi:hypothetical protein
MSTPNWNDGALQRVFGLGATVEREQGNDS